MDYKILIEFIPKTKFQKILKFFHNSYNRKNFFLTQGKPFDFSLRITNIGGAAFPGADISSILIKSASLIDIDYPISGQFKVHLLNPNASEDIFIANTVVLLQDLSWIGCKVMPLDTTDSIQTYQKEFSTDNQIEYKKNEWGQELFVISKSQISSGRLNKLVALLALLTFWEATVGILKSLKFMLGILGDVLIFVGFYLK